MHNHGIYPRANPGNVTSILEIRWKYKSLQIDSRWLHTTTWNTLTGILRSPSPLTVSKLILCGVPGISSPFRNQPGDECHNSQNPLLLCESCVYSIHTGDRWSYLRPLLKGVYSGTTEIERCYRRTSRGFTKMVVRTLRFRSSSGKLPADILNNGTYVRQQLPTAEFDWFRVVFLSYHVKFLMLQSLHSIVYP